MVSGKGGSVRSPAKRLASCEKIQKTPLPFVYVVMVKQLIVAYLMIIVFLFIIINLVVDIIYTTLDPRVRVAGARA